MLMVRYACPISAPGLISGWAARVNETSFVGRQAIAIGGLGRASISVGISTTPFPQAPVQSPDILIARIDRRAPVRLSS